MKKIKILLAFTFIILLIAGCDKSEKYETEKTTTLKGKIIINTIKKDGKDERVSILELEKAISIDGVITDKIEIEYDKSLKDNTETTITGTLKENDGSTSLKYAIEVDSIDNILSYINTFSNDIFSVAIPAKLMKTVSIKEITNGYIVYSSTNKEAFKIIALTPDEYKKIIKEDIRFDKIKSNKEYTVVIIYSTNSDEEELNKAEQSLYSEIDNIKGSVKLK